MTRKKRRQQRAGRRFDEQNVWVVINGLGTVTEVLGSAPFTVTLPAGTVLIALMIELSLLVPRLQSFPPGSVRFILNGVWIGEMDHQRRLRPGDQLTLAAEAPAPVHVSVEASEVRN